MGGPNTQATSSPRYTVTTYLAYPGTPLKDGDGNLTGQTSAAGHMWYEIGDGSTYNSYGFAPKVHGQSSGPGEVVRSDTKTYHQPGYSRTLEISAEQYQRLKQFGELGVDEQWRHFRSDYKGLTNSCIDFTWGALKHAGIERHQPAQTLANEFGFVQEVPAHDTPIDRGFDGTVKVMPNQRHLQQLAQPVPGSELNQERSHPAPVRSLMQRLLTENESGRSDLGPVSRQLLADSEREVAQVAERHGLPWDQGLTNTCYAVAATARQCGMTRVNLFHAADGQIRFGQHDGYTLREAELDAKEVANTPMAHSAQALAEMDQHRLPAALQWPHPLGSEPAPDLLPARART